MTKATSGCCNLIGYVTACYLFVSSINQLVDYISQILLSDWLSWSRSIGDRPLVAKGIDFQIENNGGKLMFCRGFISFL